MNLAQQQIQLYDWNDEPVRVTAWQLLQWKHAVSLERKGIKHSRGSVAAHVRKILNAPKRYPIKELEKYLADTWDDIKAQTDALP